MTTKSRPRTLLEVPRTLLEALVRQRQLTWAEAAREVGEVASAHERRSISLTPRHLARLARREKETNPTPSTSRALQYTFGRPIVDLLSPYQFAGDDGVVSPEHAGSSGPGTEREVLAMAADRAQKFALNLLGMADLTLEQVIEGVHDLTLAYPSGRCRNF